MHIWDEQIPNTSKWFYIDATIPNICKYVPKPDDLNKIHL